MSAQPATAPTRNEMALLMAASRLDLVAVTVLLAVRSSAEHPRGLTSLSDDLGSTPARFTL